MGTVKVLAFIALVSCVFGYRIKKSPYVGIIGGKPVSISDAPYMVYFNNYIYGLECGGSIIDDQFVLTAAHCFDGCNPEDYTVVAGTNRSDIPKDVYKIDKIISHRKYSDSTIKNDICLIKLKTPIKFSHDVGKIALVGEDLVLESGMMVQVSGWGDTHPFGDVSDVLLQVSVPYVDRRKCKKLLHLKHLPDSQICAGEKGKDTCAGDSGGPLTLNNTLVGITSYGKGLCGRLPGVYTNVQHFLPWIKENIANNSG